MYTVIYGINAATDMFLASTFNDGNNVFISTSGGGEYEGETVGSIDYLEALGDGMVERVVICSMHVSDVMSSLQSIDISLDKVFFFNPLTSKLHACLSMLQQPVSMDDVLYAFYDLKQNLPCFDVINFAVCAEQERKNRGKKFIQFVIVPDRDKDSSGLLIFYDKDDYLWRINKIIKPVFELIASCIGVNELIIRQAIKQFEFCSQFPAGYVEGIRISNVDNFKAIKHYRDEKIEISTLLPPRNAFNLVSNYVRQHCYDKKLITITLREYGIENNSIRNNNLKEWAIFIEKLDKEQYFPVLIRDTYKVFDDLPHYFSDVPTFSAASLDLHIRAALYQLAFLNMGVESGPTHLTAFLKGTRSLYFRKTSDKIATISSSSIKTYGLTEGENHFFYDNKLQLVGWCDDTFSNIDEKFNEFLKLESNSNK